MDVRVPMLGVLLGLGAAVVGCEGPDSKNGSQGEVKRVMSALTPAAPAVTMRWTSDGCEIEVVSPEGFPPAGLDPVLHVGGAAFKRYRYSTSIGLFGVVYRISNAELATLAEGAPVVIAYGPNPARGRQFGAFYRNAIK